MGRTFSSPSFAYRSFGTTLFSTGRTFTSPIVTYRSFGTTSTTTEKDLSATPLPDDSIITNNIPAEPALSVDEALNKLFEESSSTLASNASGDAWYAVAEAAQAAWSPVWYNCADQAIVAVMTTHDYTGWPIGWSIVATTMALRIVLFPLLVQAQQTSSRMAHVQPELQVLKLRYERLGSPTRAEQLQFSAQMKALFAKYQVNPFKSMIAPVVQLPVFIGMFFGLQKMPGIYPTELAAGGMWWFTDLTVPDPLYILPVVSAATFLALIEMGKEQMMITSPGPQGLMMVNVFRFMAIISLPFCASFDAAILCYWACNNLMTIGQTAILKNATVRSYFGIWDPPKPVPGTETPGLLTSVSNLVKTVQGEAVTDAQKIKKHNQEVEAQKTTFRLTRAAKERRRRGITGARNS
jgi:YidC/Oxa1 family membrane protein insertase